MTPTMEAVTRRELLHALDGLEEEVRWAKGWYAERRERQPRALVQLGKMAARMRTKIEGMPRGDE